MDHFLSVTALFAVDFVQETRVPCLIVGFDYYTRVKIAALGPLALVAAIFAASLVWAVRHHGEVKRGRVTQTASTIQHAKRRGSHMHVHICFAQLFGVSFADDRQFVFCLTFAGVCSRRRSGKRRFRFCTRLIFYFR